MFHKCYTYLPFSPSPPPLSSTGILQADVGVIRDEIQIFQLFCHEALRVFHDRLINNQDKSSFHAILAEMASKHFSQVIPFYFSSQL